MSSETMQRINNVWLVVAFVDDGTYAVVKSSDLVLYGSTATPTTSLPASGQEVRILCGSADVVFRALVVHVGTFVECNKLVAEKCISGRARAAAAGSTAGSVNQTGLDTHQFPPSETQQVTQSTSQTPSFEIARNSAEAMQRSDANSAGRNQRDAIITNEYIESLQIITGALLTIGETQERILSELQMLRHERQQGGMSIASTEPNNNLDPGRPDAFTDSECDSRSAEKLLLPAETVQFFESDTRSRTAFAVRLADTLFSKAEREQANCSGIGKQALDFRRLDFIRHTVQHSVKFGPKQDEKPLAVWRECRKAIDCASRRLKRQKK